MDKMTIMDTLELLHNHEIKCDQNTVEKWIYEGKLKATKDVSSYTMKLDDALDFLDDLSSVGTPYEKGIDDKTKIERLRKEVEKLEEKVKKLVDEKTLLELELGISPFD